MYFYVYARPHMEKVLTGALTPARLSYPDAVAMAIHNTGRDREMVEYLIHSTRTNPRRRVYIAAANGRSSGGYIVQRVEA